MNPEFSPSQAADEVFCEIDAQEFEAAKNDPAQREVARKATETYERARAARRAKTEE